jgi:hypothetical protein
MLIQIFIKALSEQKPETLTIPIAPGAKL